MRVLIVTVVHVPLDARIHERQIGALLEAGWEVTLAAPWSDCEQVARPPVRPRDLPRAVGRRRLRSLAAARRLLRDEAPRHDIVLLHDPELLLVAGAAGSTPVVWDVHEDLAASLVARPWVPRHLRSIVARLVGLLERRAERRHHMVLAESSYAGRFGRAHPVVPNVPVVPSRVPPPGPGRAVYVGRVARARGADELLELGRRLRGDVTVEVVGDAESDVVQDLTEAAARGDVRWHGFVPNDEALELIAGATVGLSLLHDLPNFRGSMPTKVLEYMAAGIPVVTTPLPLAADVVDSAGAGEVVPFGDLEAAEAAVRRLATDQAARERAGARGHAHVAEHHSWRVEGPRFVALLGRWAVGP